MKEIVIWPVYIDREKSRKEGRRIPQSLGVKNPKLENIYKTLKKMGYSAEIVRNKCYPRIHWELCGYIKVKVENSTSKSELLKEICKNYLR
ncbi:MAG TPA: signal recognition particle protein Srp19 [Methanothermococcus okinawensis]|uniref:Signal recognition particle 19 kDa protein n=1 Tax=Methanofervidicoccus abyssi TaxID=2082189 RepID=A0A401HQ32_9EURY|nr:signal recognition particle subunit SRP19/SEC65 family protein [Methanofervidicoccus abyssi]GBF36358.1 signal recognition particle subunit SRP19 [Methanofervidicoccus abyssi]HIP16111.1 signal recognition particle protein Srp19 [Methanothermococcus okinawensis]HIP34744.1 signal recognition particle protein Srp19 [Methanothermococcus okinawensis]